MPLAAANEFVLAILRQVHFAGRELVIPGEFQHHRGHGEDGQAEARASPLLEHRIDRQGHHRRLPHQADGQISAGLAEIAIPFQLGQLLAQSPVDRPPPTPRPHRAVETLQDFLGIGRRQQATDDGGPPC